jgi:3-phytase
MRTTASWIHCGAMRGKASRLILAIALAMSCSPPPGHATDSTTVVRPAARAETTPVPHGKDSADDPALWIHPTKPELSLILGTDKHGALLVYEMTGELRQTVADGSWPNNVDVLYDFPLGGRRVDLAVASCRGDSVFGVKVWVIDPARRSLDDVTVGGVIPVFGATAPYGACTYHSRVDGRSYFFVTQEGRIEQYELKSESDRIAAARVRVFGVDSKCEGMVADDEAGHLYFAEERAGVWMIGAEPNAGDRGRLVVRAHENGLTPDVEGLTIYRTSKGPGYLIVSSQGSNDFKVYEIGGDHRFLLTVDPRPGRLGDVEGTDGIAVTNCPTSRQFPRGLLVAQDGTNAPANQNFKLYGWEDVAGGRLVVDTKGSPHAAANPSVAVGDPASMPHEAPRDDEVAFADGLHSLHRSRWAVESMPLETETARLGLPGTLRFEVGLEREAENGSTQYHIPVAVDYVLTRHWEFRLEPILYSTLRQDGLSQSAGLSEFEMVATMLVVREKQPSPSLALAAEVTIPGAESPFGSGSPSYTADLILSKRIIDIDFHTNLGYTIVGDRSGRRSRNTYSIAFAMEKRLSRFDALFEVIAHSAAFHEQGSAAGRDIESSVEPEISDHELTATWGARYHVSDRAALTMGLSYENDHSVRIHPGVTLKLR